MDVLFIFGFNVNGNEMGENLFLLPKSIIPKTLRLIKHDHKCTFKSHFTLKSQENNNIGCDFLKKELLHV